MAKKALKKELRKRTVRNRVQKRLTAMANSIYHNETYRTAEDLANEYEDMLYFQAIAKEDALEHHNH